MEKPNKYEGEGRMKCQKCGKDFPEKEIEISHNIPKYIGGQDKDGRMALCSNCHEEYEFLILSSIYKKFFGEKIETKKDRRNYIYLMEKLKVKDELDKHRFRLLAIFKLEEWKNGSR